MRVLLWILGLAVVAVVVIVGLSMLGAPKASCADGAIAVSKAAEESFNTKWNGFQAAIRQGGSATVTLSEEEVTSRGVRYLADSGVPARNLQVHLCPGQGKGQATLSMDVLGQSAQVVATGHLDLGLNPHQIVVDSLEVGMVPEQIGTLAANQVLAAANIQAPNEIQEITTTSAAATLRGQK